MLVGGEWKQAVLKPGQQALSNDSGKPTVREVAVEGSLAWKEGYFAFDDIELRSVMKMIARWYDIEVVNLERNGLVILN